MSSPLLKRIKPLIHEILSSPNIVPSQVTAKTVRQSLIDRHGISKEALNNEKSEVKELILSIFRELYPDEAGGSGAVDETMSSPVKVERDVHMEPATPLKRKREELMASHSMAPSSPAVPLVDEKKGKGKTKREDDDEADEELARKLQKSLNGERSTRHGGQKKSKAGGREGGKKTTRVKSKAFVNSDGEEDGSVSGSEKPKKRKAKDGEGSGAKGGFQKPFILRFVFTSLWYTETLANCGIVTS